ncbi:hypothetical protein F8M41_000712 [Gigaspora margarita]|uniref:MD-2-related lipid-recognition domain-containing protein n=1 Tax=Gigaspora margarita TaxID=4874 RepID=A0A8H3XFK4_GIGMA|nr:hypothetical protein F8M41_000712 [Gigaspora margarita]
MKNFILVFSLFAILAVNADQNPYHLNKRFTSTFGPCFFPTELLTVTLTPDPPTEGTSTYHVSGRINGNTITAGKTIAAVQFLNGSAYAMSELHYKTFDNTVAPGDEFSIVVSDVPAPKFPCCNFEFYVIVIVGDPTDNTNKIQEYGCSQTHLFS